MDEMSRKIQVSENTLESIYRSGLKLLTPLTLEETYPIIVEEAIKLVNGDEGRVLLKDGKSLELVFASTTGAASIQKVRKKGFAFQAFSKRRAFYINTKDHPTVHPHIIKYGVRSALFIPLAYRKSTIGVLVVHSFKTKKFTDRELDILKLFGSLASLAIRKAQLHFETQKALETRDLFISMAAHELRTPLTSINGYIQLLNGRKNRMGESEARWVEQLSWESLRLTNLVKELLTVNQIKSGDLTYYFDQLSLFSVVERVVTNFSFTQPKHQLTVNNKLKENEDFIIGDFDKLVQAVGNLAENAANYSPAGSEVIISLLEKNNFLYLQIKDQGVGIDESDLPNIFERFYRGKGNSKEGMGMGLYLVKDIISRHKGTVSVKSKVAKGTTIEILLPKAKAKYGTT